MTARTATNTDVAYTGVNPARKGWSLSGFLDAAFKPSIDMKAINDPVRRMAADANQLNSSDFFVRDANGFFSQEFTGDMTVPGSKANNDMREELGRKMDYYGNMINAATPGRLEENLEQFMGAFVRSSQASRYTQRMIAAAEAGNLPMRADRQGVDVNGLMDVLSDNGNDTSGNLPKLAEIMASPFWELKSKGVANLDTNGNSTGSIATLVKHTAQCRETTGSAALQHREASAWTQAMLECGEDLGSYFGGMKIGVASGLLETDSGSGAKARERCPVQILTSLTAPQSRGGQTSAKTLGK